MKKSKRNRRYVGGLVVLLSLTLLWFAAFAAGDEPQPPPEPKMITLTASPESIYLGGGTSIITATVYNDMNGSDPMPNRGVTFTTSLGTLTYLSPVGLNLAPDTCWAQTNQSGVARALLTAEFELGTAQIHAQTGGATIVNATVEVELLQPDYGVMLLPDNQTKEANLNEHVTYYIEVKNLGTGMDTYILSLILAETDFVELDKTQVTLAGGESELVALTVASYFAGSYSTTVQAVSPNADTNLTVTTIVRPFYNLSLVLSPDEPQIVVPGEEVSYTVTLTNHGNTDDSYILSAEAPVAVQVTLSKGESSLLRHNESDELVVNVSSAHVGVYLINVTATSIGDPSVKGTVLAQAVVTRAGVELDTGAGTYPSISGIHTGTIIPNHTVIVSRLYTYPAAGTGGHTEYVELCNTSSGWCINATWDGYQEDYHNLTFPERFTLSAGCSYNYTILTGSYPQVIHQTNWTTLDGSLITCTSFVDVYGNEYDDWIPALWLFP